MPSSMIVRSAPSSVSKTLSKPSLRRPVTSCPVLTAPGTRPYASAMATRTAGAIEMTHSLRSSPTLASSSATMAAWPPSLPPPAAFFFAAAGAGLGAAAAAAFASASATRVTTRSARRAGRPVGGFGSPTECRNATNPRLRAAGAGAACRIFMEIMMAAAAVRAQSCRREEGRCPGGDGRRLRDAWALSERRSARGTERSIPIP
mmetsp:Transcript_41736/g.124838  ORF Transcript_41736/g.124838 Transcript_41736/m.124838 type:complete len:204 (+) Transcript_41736:1450-2061(+)